LPPSGGSPSLFSSFFRLNYPPQCSSCQAVRVKKTSLSWLMIFLPLGLDPPDSKCFRLRPDSLPCLSWRQLTPFKNQSIHYPPPLRDHQYPPNFLSISAVSTYCLCPKLKICWTEPFSRPIFVLPRCKSPGFRLPTQFDLNFWHLRSDTEDPPYPIVCALYGRSDFLN